jgi:hypothetical protein
MFPGGECIGNACEREAMNRYSIAEAARALGVTQQAIHGRIGRGTIPAERDSDGKQYVFLTDEEIHEQRMNNPSNALQNGFINDYITALKSEVEDWKEEARRKDTIIAQMNQTMGSLINRLPELEAPQDTAPEATESSVRGSEEESRGVIPPDAQNRSWWRKLFSSVMLSV